MVLTRPIYRRGTETGAKGKADGDISLRDDDVFGPCPRSGTLEPLLSSEVLTLEME